MCESVCPLFCVSEFVCPRRASINHARNMDDPWIYYRLCISRRIDTWQIVYLLYKDACPIISIHKNEI